MGRSDPHSVRRLGRDSLVYGLGTVLNRIAGFLLLPVYTRYLTPADYGLLQILDLTIEIAAIAASAGAATGVARFYFKTDSRERRNAVLFTAYATQIGLNLIGTTALMLAAPLIWKHALSGAGSVEFVYIAAANFLSGTLIPLPLAMLRLDQRPVAAVTVSLVKLVLNQSLNILFVVGLAWGPRGILVATLVTNVVVGLGMGFMLLRRTGLCFLSGVFRDLRRFAVPAQIATAGQFIIQFGDRFFLEHYHGLDVVGPYGIAYQFGFLLTGMAWAPFLQAWEPQRFQLVTLPRAERDRAFNRALLLGNLIVISVAVAISLFVTPVIRIMTTPGFHTAAAVVPVILAALVFEIWRTVAAFGFYVAERPWYIAVMSWVGVVMVLVLYWLMIPPWGALGAAGATLVTAAARWWLTARLSHRLWPISYAWPRAFTLLGIGAAVVVAATLARPESIPAQIGIGLLGCLAFASLVWIFVLGPVGRRMVRDLAAAPGQFKDFLRG